MSRRRTALDHAILAVAGLIVVLLAYLGYAVWAQRASQEASSPAARAVANLAALVRKRPNEVGPRLQLAAALVAAAREKEAVDQYQQALRLDKENPAALLGLGQLAMRGKQWSTAEAYWRRMISKLENGEFAAKDDRLEAAYFYLGTALLEQRKYEDAISNLKQAVRIRPDASDTHYALSVAYARANSRDKSMEELTIALAFDPTMPEANYDMGQSLLKKGDVASAAERFRVAADKAPQAREPKLALEALGSADDHIKAAEAFSGAKIASATAEARIAVALDPRDSSAIRLLGQLFEKQNKKQEALAAYDRFLSLVPGDPDVTAAADRLRKGGK